MANWFYYDNNGQKQGPVTGSQLKQLAAQGLVLPETVIETETGRQVTAKEVKGLLSEPATVHVPLPAAEDSAWNNVRAGAVPVWEGVKKAAKHTAQAAARAEKRSGLFAWLFDFGFRDLRITFIIRIVIGIIYAIGVIAAVVLLLLSIYGILEAIVTLPKHSNDTVLQAVSEGHGVLGILLHLLSVFLTIFLLACFRLYCELAFFTWDWLETTRDAAKRFIAEDKRKFPVNNDDNTERS
ncbi:MAG: DUF4339 domain-containing protein [Planctomycetaceae bacterium]|jgi:uncharacterized membrane protein|nr:DUF4339 domain-containing protein [Planctomycetaceae bacterium]